MRKYFRNQLLMQVDMLRWIIPHEELSKRLGDATERCMARYIAGKTHLRQDEFEKIAKALTIDAMLAQAWALSLDVRQPEKDAVSRMIDRACRHWRRHSRLAARRVPPSPSPMTVIRVKYVVDRLPQKTPPLCGSTHSATKTYTRGP